MLAKTLGVPLFQEQAMQVAIHCAGFSPSEADQLRRSMATFKVTGGVSQFREKFLKGMADNGHNATFAENTFRQIEGFGSYGFPESHAASFAIIAYASSWVKCHHPDVFCCALLNSQPMGFYAPAQVVRDAAAHGVEIRPVSINASRWDCTLEGNTGSPHAVRLGLRMAKGLGNEDGAKIVVQRADRPFATVEETWRRCGVPVAALERLAEADAFSPIGLDRRQALWAIRGLADSALPLWAAADAGALPQAEVAEPGVSLTVMSEAREVVEDYRSVSLTLRRHPVAFLRPALKARGVVPCGDLPSARDGRWGRIRRPRAGAAEARFCQRRDVHYHRGRDGDRQCRDLALGLRRQPAADHLRPHAGGAWPDPARGVGGAYRGGDGWRFFAMLASLGRGEEDFPLPHGRGDEVKRGSAPDPREGKPGIKVPTRDFR